LDEFNAHPDRTSALIRQMLKINGVDEDRYWEIVEANKVPTTADEWANRINSELFNEFEVLDDDWVYYRIGRVGGVDINRDASDEDGRMFTSSDGRWVARLNEDEGYFEGFEQ
jgi:hypothetical protein